MRFKGTPATAVYFGVSKNTLKIWRNGNAKSKRVLIEGVHWARCGKSVLYNIPLLEDWVANHAANPEAHQKAIDDYRKSLPSHSL
jgi:hypothetical protein